jgi:hypothetical protein
MFEQWSRSRDAFQQEVRGDPFRRPADKWQKLYYRGLTPDGHCPVPEHQSKLQVRQFANPELAGKAVVKSGLVRDSHEALLSPASAIRRTAPSVEKYEWLLSSLEQQRQLSAEASAIFRCEGVMRQDFLDHFYAPARPVVLGGAVSAWPAVNRWDPDYLRTCLSGRMVEYQGGRCSGSNFERHKDQFKRQAPFDQFLQEMKGNNAYITAYNSATNEQALRPLRADMGILSEYLTPDPEAGMMWIGPADTFTPLHHDLTNNLLVQVVGSKRIVLAPATELPNLYNDQHVFSEVGDVTDPSVDLSGFAKLREVQFQEVHLVAGDALFIPLGWWHQVRAVDFSISITYTNFLWRNDFHLSYPNSLHSKSS